VRDLKHSVDFLFLNQSACAIARFPSRPIYNQIYRKSSKEKGKLKQFFDPLPLRLCMWRKKQETLGLFIFNKLLFISNRQSINIILLTSIRRIYIYIYILRRCEKPGGRTHSSYLRAQWLWSFQSFTRTHARTHTHTHTHRKRGLHKQRVSQVIIQPDAHRKENAFK